MIKLFAAAALTFGAVAAAPAVAAETLTYQGVTYEYTVTEQGATRVISGHDLDRRRPFVLRVARGRVEGEVNGSMVSFSLRDVKRTSQTSTKSQIAAR